MTDNTREGVQGEEYVCVADLVPLTQVVPGELDQHWEDKLGAGRLLEHRQEIERLVRAQQEADTTADDVFIGIGDAADDA